MRYLIAFFLIFLFTSCSEKTGENREAIWIEETAEGYNIYSGENKEILLEYTGRNSDSLTLALLEEIYFTAREHRTGKAKYEPTSVNFTLQK